MSERTEETNGKPMASFDAKLKLLKFNRKKDNTIIDGSNIVAMERQSKALNTVMDEVDVLRRNVEQFKFGKGDEPDAVAKWGAELDGEIKETDEAIAKLTDAISELRSHHSTRDREKQQELKQKEREEQSQLAHNVIPTLAERRIYVKS